jgi:hypothetical protein
MAIRQVIRSVGIAADCCGGHMSDTAAHVRESEGKKEKEAHRKEEREAEANDEYIITQRLFALPCISILITGIEQRREGSLAHFSAFRMYPLR